ncbi:unnamed protein product [Trypanosoma congolense IL3000]|uniref:WGS project CAEQ00000000 data, annotated contig 423 n=1 Tax=Trypanosoma congolense (strain IL3000) TaxID=1068625 RepID=F9WFT7_TRYCI|nr:unnamed protein product [Trypanosoma congolense IL3000]
MKQESSPDVEFFGVALTRRRKRADPPAPLRQEIPTRLEVHPETRVSETRFPETRLLDRSLGTLTPPCRSLWTLEMDVGIVLLEGIRNPHWVFLDDFLRPLCPDPQPKYRDGWSLSCLLQDPARCIPDTAFRDKVMQQLPRLRTRQRIHMLATIRYLAWRNNTTLRDWSNWQEHTPLERTPRFLLRWALETAIDVAATPFVPPCPIRHANGPDAESDQEEDRDSSTNDNRDTARLDGSGPPPGPVILKWSTRIQEVLRAGCWSWELVPLADFLTEEWSFHYEEGNRPTASLTAFLKAPARYVAHEKRWEDILQGMHTKLEVLKNAAIEDEQYLQHVGVHTLDQWDCMQGTFSLEVRWVTRSILDAACEKSEKRTAGGWCVQRRKKRTS